MTTAEAELATKWAELAWSSSHTQRHILKLADQAQELGLELNAKYLRYVALHLGDLAGIASKKP